MGHPLDGVQAKLDRSLEHLDALGEEVLVFHNSQPYTLTETPVGDGWAASHFHILREPPLRLGVIAGDYAQNLRAALDHLVYQLARMAKKSPGGTAVPIAMTSEAYLQPRRNGQPSMRDRCLDGVREEHRALIDVVQPYVGRSPAEAELDMLAHLRRFTNADKHRVIHPAFGQLVSVAADPVAGSVNIELNPADPLPVLAEDTEVYRVRLTRLTNEQMQVKVSINFTIGFGRYGLTDGDFRNIHAYVAWIIGRFRPYFA